MEGENVSRPPLTMNKIIIEIVYLYLFPLVIRAPFSISSRTNIWETLA